VRLAVALRLGLVLCIPHQCQCGSPVDARRLHSRIAPGRSARRDTSNGLVARCLASAGTPVTKEPTGLFRTDGKRPDGLTRVPQQSGKSSCWDVTVICPLAELYVTGSARGRCCSGTRRFSQRGNMCHHWKRIPLCAHRGRNLGPMNTSARQLFANLGKKISSTSGDDREGAFLFQRVSVLVQRYNAVLLNDTLPATDCTD